MINLDFIDQAILKCLKENAKMSQKELANRVGLTITPTFERVKNLERKGIIEGYTVQLNKEKIGKGLQVICQVSLKEHSKEVMKRLKTQLFT